jgi:uncharacterized protein (DUF2132 family)
MEQPNNPLHGVKLIDILEYLAKHIGWEGMAADIPIRCFQFDPSIKSSLAFLRKNRWARDKVEHLYLSHIQGYRKKESSEKKSGNPIKYAKRNG